MPLLQQDRNDRYNAYLIRREAVIREARAAAAARQHKAELRALEQARGECIYRHMQEGGTSPRTPYYRVPSSYLLEQHTPWKGVGEEFRFPRRVPPQLAAMIVNF